MISVERDGRVSIVRLDHGKVNVLDLELLQAITATFHDLHADDAIVLTGSGRAFSAGVDLRRVTDGGADYVMKFMPALSEAILAVFDCPRPVVAAINGHAIAGGCVLAAACDLRFMSQGTIGMTELLIGVPFPAAALEVFRYVGGAATASFVLTGITLEPTAAQAAGLIHGAIDPKRLLAHAIEQARVLARIHRETYALTKAQLHRPARELIENANRLDDSQVAAEWSIPECLSRIRSYLDSLARR